MAHNDECIACLIRSVSRSVFKRIHEDREGEMTLQEYCVQARDIAHEEIVSFTMNFCEQVKNGLIADFGINDALHLYHDNHGELQRADRNVSFTSILLTVIFIESDEWSYDEYNEWVGSLNESDDSENSE